MHDHHQLFTNIILLFIVLKVNSKICFKIYYFSYNLVINIIGNFDSLPNYQKQFDQTNQEVSNLWICQQHLFIYSGIDRNFSRGDEKPKTSPIFNKFIILQIS